MRSGWWVLFLFIAAVLFWAGLVLYTCTALPY